MQRALGVGGVPRLQCSVAAQSEFHRVPAHTVELGAARSDRVERKPTYRASTGRRHRVGRAPLANARGGQLDSGAFKLRSRRLALALQGAHGMRSRNGREPTLAAPCCIYFQYRDTRNVVAESARDDGTTTVQYDQVRARANPNPDPNPNLNPNLNPNPNPNPNQVYALALWAAGIGTLNTSSSRRPRRSRRRRGARVRDGVVSPSY